MPNSGLNLSDHPEMLVEMGVELAPHSWLATGTVYMDN